MKVPKGGGRGVGAAAVLAPLGLTGSWDPTSNRSNTLSVFTHWCPVPGSGSADSQQEARKRARAGAAAASRARRQSRQVPALIFQIEEYERHLIRLSAQGGPQQHRPAWPSRCCFASFTLARVSLHLVRAMPPLPPQLVLCWRLTLLVPHPFPCPAGVNLMASARRATNRDFKIVLERQEGPEEAEGRQHGKRARQQALQTTGMHAQGELRDRREEGGEEGCQADMMDAEVA